MVSRHWKLILVLLLVALAAAGYYLAYRQASCVVDGIPQPCWVCGSCPALSDLLSGQ